METNNKKWLVIINPNAGKRKGEQDWDKISALLNSFKLNFRPVFTEGPHHATELTIQNIQNNADNIIVIGGDGTLNEVVNGIFLQNYKARDKITLGMIPVGTGNDWGRTFNIPSKYDEAIKIILKNKTFIQDAGVVKYQQSGKEKERYFINMAGMGFDAAVARKANRLKESGKFGVMIYILTILSTLLKYEYTNTTINIDGRNIQDDIFSISVGIGKYCGGGMSQTPDAVTDDGLFDITIIKRMTKLDVIWNIRRLYDGSIIKHSKVLSYTCRKIFIDSIPPISIETDGESLGHSPLEIEIIPKSVTVITG